MTEIETLARTVLVYVQSEPGRWTIGGIADDLGCTQAEIEAALAQLDGIVKLSKRERLGLVVPRAPRRARYPKRRYPTKSAIILAHVTTHPGQTARTIAGELQFGEADRQQMGTRLNSLARQQRIRSEGSPKRWFAATQNDAENAPEPPMEDEALALLHRANRRLRGLLGWATPPLSTAKEAASAIDQIIEELRSTLTTQASTIATLQNQRDQRQNLLDTHETRLNALRERAERAEAPISGWWVYQEPTEQGLYRFLVIGLRGQMRIRLVRVAPAVFERDPDAPNRLAVLYLESGLGERDREPLDEMAGFVAHSRIPDACWKDTMTGEIIYG